MPISMTWEESYRRAASYGGRLFRLAFAFHHSEDSEAFWVGRCIVLFRPFYPSSNSLVSFSLVVVSRIIQVVLLIFRCISAMFVCTVSVLIFRTDLFIRIFVGRIVLSYIILVVFRNDKTMTDHWNPDLLRPTHYHCRFPQTSAKALDPGRQ
jgi:hypothetical protein